MTAWERWKLYPQQVFIACDQLLNALIPPVTCLSWSDETLSARCYRASRDGRLFGRLLRPVIDLLFLWQTRDHCYHAYIKERQRANLPPEYRA